MTFDQHETSFAGKTVEQYEIGGELPNPATSVPVIRVDYEDEGSATDILVDLLQQPGIDQMTGLVVGTWVGEDMYEASPTEVLETLYAAAPQLPSLTALFVGDITYEENEVSWTHQTDYEPIWSAFPKLEHLRIRGSNGLQLGKVEHNNLKTLIIETGGLPVVVVKSICDATLPNLENLEIYLGTDNYGWDGSIADLRPLFEAGKFPKLQYLGLRDSEIVDEIAKEIAEASVLDQVKELDLSLGTMTDVGGQALLDSSKVKKLEKLSLQHHFMSDEMMSKLASLGPIVNVDDQNKADDDDYRYVAISE